MPCRSDYMDPTTTEIKLSRVYQVLDELHGKTVDDEVDRRRSWDGYDPRVYSKAVSKKLLDEKTAEACQLLRETADVGHFSLELQIWWRDHQAADKAREARAAIEAKRKTIRKQALAKLTLEEIEALGLK